MKWEKIGEVSVDAGIVWIGDPCYVLQDTADERPEALGKSWSEFCDKMNDDMEAERVHKLNFDGGSDGMGIVVGSGYGDGTYPVYVKRNREGGRIMALMVDFDEAENEEDDER